MSVSSSWRSPGGTSNHRPKPQPLQCFNHIRIRTHLRTPEAQLYFNYVRTTYCIYARSTVLCFEHKQFPAEKDRSRRKRGCIFVGRAVKKHLGRIPQRKDSHKNTKRNNRNSCFIGWLKLLLSILDCFVCILREEKKMKWSKAEKFQRNSSEGDARVTKFLVFCLAEMIWRQILQRKPPTRSWQLLEI